VAIPPHILEALRFHVEHFAEPDGMAFLGPKGAPTSNANFGAKVWRPARGAVGLPELRLHDLRGLSATVAARHGATTKELMKRLGHSTPDMAMRYQRAEAERDESIARAMSQGRAHDSKHDSRRGENR
jgi:integrase